MRLCHTILVLDNATVLFLLSANCLYFLALVESTVIVLSHPFDEMLQGDIHIIQSN